MLILLPPSEGKSQPVRGRPLVVEELSFGALTPARKQVLDALVAASSGPDILEILKLPESLAATARANALVRELPTAPAASVYTGVLYEAFAHARLDAAAKRRAAASVLVFSALFGVVRLGDRIPAYRLSGGTRLPGVGVLSRFWREHLDEVLPADRLILDCRSSVYAGMWTPPGAVPVRVFREQAGRRTVVSHMAKHSRGLVARALCSAPRTPRTVEEAAAAASAWFDTNEVRTATGALVRARVELGDTSLDVVTD